MELNLIDAVETYYENKHESDNFPTYFLNIRDYKLYYYRKIKKYNSIYISIDEREKLHQAIVDLGYIPFLNSSKIYIDVIWKYIFSLNDCKTSNYFKGISQEFDSFCLNFKLYFDKIDAMESFNAYEEKYIVQKIIKWCIQNSIEYVTD